MQRRKNYLPQKTVLIVPMTQLNSLVVTSEVGSFGDHKQTIQRKFPKHIFLSTQIFAIFMTQQERAETRVFF